MREKTNSIHSRISFVIGIVVLCLLIVALLTWKLDIGQREYTSHLFIGIPLMLAWFLSIIGISKVFRSRREKKSFQWYFGLTVNGIVLLAAMIAITANAIIIAKFFSLI